MASPAVRIEIERSRALAVEVQRCRSRLQESATDHATSAAVAAQQAVRVQREHDKSLRMLALIREARAPMRDKMHSALEQQKVKCVQRLLSTAPLTR